MIAKRRGIKGYKSISEERLLSSLNGSESVKNRGYHKSFQWIER